MFHHLKKEFEFLNNLHIKVDNVEATVWFQIDEDDLMHKINNKYKDHHVFIDEVGISNDKDISLLKKVAEQMAHQSLSFWVSVTYFRYSKYADKLKSELQGIFTIIKDELNVPLRNTSAIVGAAHNIGKSNGIDIQAIL